MAVPRLLTVRRMAELFCVPKEDVMLAIAERPAVREISRADGLRVFDREAADIIRCRINRIHDAREEAIR